MKTNVPIEFEDLLESNAQALGNTGEAKPPTGEALGVTSGEPSLVPPLLWNRKAPSYVRQQELPWHRTAMEMAANGYTCEEIAARLGCSPPTVQDVLKQPHNQQAQVNLIAKAASEDHEVCELIKANVKLAVEALAEIVGDEKARNGDRIQAARELLDRRYGKPNQPMNRGTDVDLNNLSDQDLAKIIVSEMPTATGTNV